MTTTKKVTISSSRNRFKKINENIESPLNAKWKTHTTGLLAVERKFCSSAELPYAIIGLSENACPGASYFGS
jgi:hypothetical protein